MTHYSVIWIWGDYVVKHDLVARGGLWPLVAVGTLTMLAVGWLTLKLYDEPVRRYLRSNP